MDPEQPESEQKMGEGTRVTTEQTLTERDQSRPFGEGVLLELHDLSALYEYAENMTV